MQSTGSAGVPAGTGSDGILARFLSCRMPAGTPALPCRPGCPGALGERALPIHFGARSLDGPQRLAAVGPRAPFTKHTDKGTNE